MGWPGPHRHDSVAASRSPPSCHVAGPAFRATDQRTVPARGTRAKVVIMVDPGSRHRKVHPPDFFLAGVKVAAKVSK